MDIRPPPRVQRSEHIQPEREKHRHLHDIHESERASRLTRIPKAFTHRRETPRIRQAHPEQDVIHQSQEKGQEKHPEGAIQQPRSSNHDEKNDRDCEGEDPGICDLDWPVGRVRGVLWCCFGVLEVLGVVVEGMILSVIRVVVARWRDGMYGVFGSVNGVNGERAVEGEAEEVEPWPLVLLLLLVTDLSVGRGVRVEAVARVVGVRSVVVARLAGFLLSKGASDHGGREFQTVRERRRVREGEDESFRRHSSGV